MHGSEIKKGLLKGGRFRQNGWLVGDHIFQDRKSGYIFRYYHSSNSTVRIDDRFPTTILTDGWCELSIPEPEVILTPEQEEGDDNESG